MSGSEPVWCVENHSQQAASKEARLQSEKVDFDNDTELLDVMASYEEDYDGDSPVERRPLVGSKKSPQDRFYFVFFIFAFLGLASLLPWNFFITAKKYFDFKLRNTSLPSNASYDDPSHATQDQVTFESYLSIVSNGSNLLFSMITVMIVRSVSVKNRIVCSSIFILLIFIATTVMVKVNTDSWQDSFLVFTLIMAALMSGGQSVLNSSVLGLSAIFPPIYSQSAMNGQAAGGAFSAVVSILTHWTGGDAITSAFIYFFIAIVATLLAIIAYVSLHFVGFAQYHMVIQGSMVIDISSKTERKNKDRENKSCVSKNKSKDVQAANNDYQLLGQVNSHSRFAFYWNILKKIWLYCLSVTIVFWVTLSIFPSVCSLIKTQDKNNKKWDEYFMLVVCFLLFNIGDFLGRLFTFVCKFPGNNRPIVLLILTILRAVFIPLLMLCNAQPRHHLSVVFEHDFYPIILILSLGLSNGYLGTLCFSFGPVHVGENEAEVAGIMLAMAMTLGLALGSFLSIGLVKLI